MSRLFTFMNFAGLGVSSVIITSVAHIFIENTVNNIEKSLIENKAEESAFIPINEWRRKNFLEQIMSNPSWKRNID
jgi:hypothetical protein